MFMVISRFRGVRRDTSILLNGSFIQTERLSNDLKEVGSINVCSEASYGSSNEA